MKCMKTQIPQRHEVIQPKLEIGQPNDKYEREADTIADKVVMMPNNPATMHMQSASDGPDISMKCAECEKEEKLRMKPAVQRSGDGKLHASSSFSGRLQGSKGQGQPLSEAVSNEMGSKIGADFSHVRIHTDSKAVRMNQEIGAQAFTHENNVYFNKGKYEPSSSRGRHLLAHELAHVVQQNSAPGTASPIQRMLPCPSTLSSGDPTPQGFKPYYGDSSWFHCGFRGILEDRAPSPEDPQNECFYDETGALVDENHEAAGCRGTPNDYDSSASTWDHIFNDRGGIWHRGWEAFWTSRGHDKVSEIEDCEAACAGQSSVLRALCLSGCLGDEEVIP